MKRTSSIATDRVKTSRQNRFNPIRGLTADKMASALDEFRVGNVRPAALIWDALLNRDGTLKTVSAKRFKDASRRPWEILKTGKTKRAQEHAAALNYFYNNLRATNAAEPDEQGGFSLLRRQMLTAIGMKRAIHETILKPRRANGVELPLDDKGATLKLDTLLTAEFRFCPLYWFESRNGPLAYLKSDWDYYGDPLKSGEWMVTCGDGLMESCSVEYIFKSLARKDLLGFSDKFGQPAVDIEVNAKPGDDEWEEAKQMATDFGNNLSLVRTVGGKVTLIETAKSASTLPQPLLIEDAKREIIIIWQGGDLGTLSSKDGQGTGSQQQEKSSDVLTEGDCDLLTDTLNANVDRLVIDYLFGEEPLAYIKILPPKKLEVQQDRETAGWLVDRGVAVGKNQIRERLGWSEPDEDDEPIENTEVLSDGRLHERQLPQLRNPALLNEDTAAKQARAAAADILRPVLAAYDERLQRILSITDPALRKQRWEEIQAELKTLEQDHLTDPIALVRAFEQINAKALAAGLQGNPTA